MNPLLLAIDPGKNGAIAWRCDGVPPDVMKLTENPSDLVLQIRSILENQAGICFFEEVGGFIRGNPQPGSSMFKFGRQVGVVEGILASVGIEIRKIRPQKWQKALSAITRPGEDKSAHKRRLRALALELYPQLTRKITLQTADALLILHVGRELTK